jgi:hypothetical protein
MKVFLDECIDWRLSREIVGHEVSTARRMGWTSLKNGELLALVAKSFDVFVLSTAISLSNRISQRSMSPSSFSKRAQIGWPI